MPCPSAAAWAMVASISGAASDSLPRRHARIIAPYGAARLPVASQTASASAISEAAAAKSPLQAALVPSAPRSIGSWSSAPLARASRTCRTSSACQTSSSHSALAAAWAIHPQRSPSSTAMSASRKASAARRNVAAAAAGPSVTNRASPSRTRSTGRGGCSIGGSALAARETSSRSLAPASRPANSAAIQALR